MSRLSISVPPDVEDTIRTAAEAAGLPVSVWLARAAQRAAVEQAAIADGLAAVAEFEADDGALTDAERAEARQALIDAGVVPSQRAAS
ncbi:MAG: hypothetical protein ACRDTJ_23255 [Pseudonocardiaceae bacterium]